MFTLIFIDDERDIEDVTWVVYPEGIKTIILRTYQDFLNYLPEITSETIPYLLFSFDHDLGLFENGVELTGLTCAKSLINYLNENGIKYKGQLNAISHSQNPVGRNTIENYLKDKTKIELECHGCGHKGEDVYQDDYGFNICRVNKCTPYSVRGLSREDF